MDIDISFYVEQSEHQLNMKKRLIAAHEKVDSLYYDEWCQLLDLMSIFARLGLKTAMNEAFGLETPKIEFDKIKLELDFNGFKYPTLEDRDKILGRFDLIRDIKDKHGRTLHRIQEHHQVTGLVVTEYKFVGGESVHAPGHGDGAELPLIKEDLEILSRHKDRLVNAWKRSLGDTHKIYRWTDDNKDHPCKLCTMAEFNAYVATCKWVEPWIRDRFPSINMGRTTDMTGYGKVQSFTAIPLGYSVNEIHL
jgi:hypothetical protein